MFCFCMVIFFLSLHSLIALALPASSVSAVSSVSRTSIHLTLAEESYLRSIFADASIIERLALPTSSTLQTISSTIAPASSSTAPADSTAAVNVPTECLSGGANVRKIKFVSVSADTPPPLYAITTQWKVHYLTQIRQALEGVGFRVIEPGDVLYNRTIGCDWASHGTYSAISVRRGKLDFIGTDLHPLGVKDDLERIKNILLSTYPFTEITLILTFLVGIPVSFFGLCFCIAHDDSAKTRRTKRLQTKRELRTREKRELKRKSNEKTVVDSEKLHLSPPFMGESRLLQLPPEIHLEIVSHLLYHEMKTARLTCRYLHSLIPAEDLDIIQWKDYLINRETARRPRQEIPCFHCLRLKPHEDFPLLEQNHQKYELSYPSYRGRLLPAYSINLVRRCIECEIKCSLSTDGMLPFMKSQDEYVFVCGACGEQPPSEVLPVHHKMKSGGCWCDPCFQKNKEIIDHVWMRPLQTLIALTSFSISMTGTVPNYLAPWACHATLCIITMGSCLNSYIIRVSEDAASGYIHFGLKREICATLLWAAVTATWTWELVMLDWSLPGEGRICAVTIFCYFELLTFLWSCGRDWTFMKAYNGYRKRLKDLDIPSPLR